MRIDVWSDVVCPWCFLGKRRLDRAIEQLDWADEIEIRWRAFLLDPTATAEPADLERTIDRKYGPGAFVSMTQRLGALGEADGINYRFDRAQRVSTLDAHRLLAWAFATGGGSVQATLQERLFLAYFEEGANVASHDTLIDVASEVGLDRADAADVLATNRFSDEVNDDFSAAAEREITGVPAFVIADRFLIPGAQDVDTIVSVLNRAKERFSTAAN